MSLSISQRNLPSPKNRPTSVSAMLSQLREQRVESMALVKHGDGFQSKAAVSYAVCNRSQRGRFSCLPHSIQDMSWDDLNGCGLAWFLSTWPLHGHWACVWSRCLRMVVLLTQVIVFLGLGTKSECAQRPRRKL